MVRSKVIFNYMGKILIIIGIAMLLCVSWSIYYGEDIVWKLTFVSLFTILTGVSLSITFRNNQALNYREGFAIVSIGWIVASIFGSLPYVVSGHVFTYADAIFETVSGFSTTGATIFSDVEILPKSLLFWRSLTQWLGGMGIMALFIAITVGIGVRGNQIFRAEIPGPVSNKISPRIRETAKYLWLTYVAISAVLFLLLWLFGMDLFDALCHTFSTMATGGFSTRNQSIGYYGPVIQWIIIVFMFIGGTNFALHYFAFTKRTLSGYFQNKEFKFYALIVLVATVLSTIGLLSIYGVGENLRTSLFHVVSIMTTTGFVTADYNSWFSLNKAVILVLMFIGASAGSTSGNIKVGRYLIMFQRAKIELRQMVHPRALISLRFGDKVLNDSLIINVLQFFFIYMMIILIGTVIMGALGLDLLTGFTAVVACMGNVGPGFGAVGPTSNYAFIPDVGKYILSVIMLLGRLEIYPLLVLFLPEYWKDR
ncbi:MAG TPA: TrkH family potassium uptake protein [Syntrophomonadaceae bacterium]|nr:TrkH family potassium uptake protein [Syntrophomonadaceae bacterium]